MGIDAFVDPGFTSEEAFRRGLLQSPDFTLPMLRGLVSTNSSTKSDLVTDVAAALESGALAPATVMAAYVRQTRGWLSFKVGNYGVATPHANPDDLLREFGEPGWYGPIKEPDSDVNRVWYLKTHRLVHNVPLGGGEVDFQPAWIRWTIVAELTSDYAALTWDGFTHAPKAFGTKAPPVPFPYWLHIPAAWNDLGDICEGSWEEFTLSDLVLETLWQKYVGQEGYRWDHRRIRSEASGVAFSAHSGAPDEIDIRGLKALTGELATAACDALGATQATQKSKVGDALLRTLIHGWGPKSYEFSLDSNAGPTPLFRGHCYFGQKESGQDSFQHIHCYKSYGGSSSALSFLLKELGNGGA